MPGEQTPLPRTQVLEEFSRQVSRADWPSGSPATISYAALDGYLSKYQVWGPGFRAAVRVAAALTLLSPLPEPP